MSALAWSIRGVDASAPVNPIAGAALAGFGHLSPQTVGGASPVASTSGTARG
jgi:hypothetical protein